VRLSHPTKTENCDTDFFSHFLTFFNLALG
jgi:hypothetical protein